MARTRIKICGVTRRQDIAVAVKAGVDALGLVLVDGSPRALSLDEAVDLRGAVPPFVTCVALVMNPLPATLQAIAQRLRPDCLQFHGDEPVSMCDAAGLPYIKALALGGSDPTEGAALAGAYPDAGALLADSHAPGQAGGTGKTFDWTRAAVLARERRLVLAGGLHADNVGAAIEAVAPYAVDVSSGVESAPGEKSADRIRAFVAAVRRADAKNPVNATP